VAQDVVIACSTTDNNCAAWREGSDEQLWNISIENVSAFIGLDNNSQTVYRREGVRYVILAFHSAVNLDTGELVSFDLPSLESYYLVSAADGWLVHSTSASGSVVYAFGLEGGAAIDMSATPSTTGGTRSAQDAAESPRSASMKSSRRGGPPL